METFATSAIPYAVIPDPAIALRVQQIEAIAGPDCRFQVQVEKPPGEAAPIVRVICVFRLAVRQTANSA